MRTLTSIESSDIVLSDIRVRVTASDNSRYWDLSGDDIINVTPLSWEIPFMGGMGKISTYDLTIVTSASFLKYSYSKLIKADVEFTVNVNSDNFQPHRGQVRGMERSSENPNIITLKIYDRYVDSNEFFPPSIQDSYTLHPAVSKPDFGYPIYYGKLERPIYFTAINSRCSHYLVPLNIDDVNAPGQININLDTKNTDPNKYIKFNGSWTAGQTTVGVAAPTNGGGIPFTDDNFSDTRAWELQGAEPYELESSESSVILSEYKGVMFLTTFNRLGESNLIGGTAYINNKSGIYSIDNVKGYLYENQAAPATIHGKYSIKYGNVTDGYDLIVNSESYTKVTRDNYNYNLITNVIFNNENNFIVEIQPDGGISSYNGFLNGIFTLELTGTLDASQYKNFSIFKEPVNTNTPCISTNPIHILTHIFSYYTSYAFVQDQASASQYDVDNYICNCMFFERQPVLDIVDELGAFSGVNIWQGDSGQLNFRTYQDRGEAVVDMILTSSDYLRLKVMDNPLGISQFSDKKYSEIEFQYSYDFGMDSYLDSTLFDKNNNTYCSSAHLSGINGKLTKKTKHTLDAGTINLWAERVIKKNAGSESFVEAVLPAKYFQLEVADVIKVQSPLMINGSESLYQVTRIQHDYIAGEVNLTAQELF